MIQLLIISENADFSKSIEAMLAAPDRFECHHRFDLEAASNLLEMPLFSACLLDAELTSIKAIRQIETLRSLNPGIPLMVFSGESSKEWEEEAAIRGADFILAKPIRGPLFLNLLNKVLPNGHPVAAGSIPPAPPSPAVHSKPGSRASLPALEILRDFSRIFSFSLNLKSFTYQFALKLREVTGVNRIAIFLEQAPPSFFGSVPVERNTRLQCLCSVGIDPELFRVLTLSTRSGIGQTVLKSGRILRNSVPSDTLFPPDHEVQREFTLLGGQVAIPILDRERAIGVAILGDSLTGQDFSNEELELLFHLMEELGMAIKSNLLHDHLLANHKLITSVFNQMSHGCLVVDSELNVLHANPAFLGFFDLAAPVQFSELPRRVAGLLYESAHDGKVHQPFLFPDPSRPGQTYRISILPFREEHGTVGAMLSVEDFTPVETARKAELKASSLELTALMAEKFAHEIRNALLPIDTCRQLIPERSGDAEFYQTLEDTLTQETRRIGRLADQLLYLSRQETPISDTASLADLLQEAFAKVQPMAPAKAALKCNGPLTNIRVPCNQPSLVQAFVEVLLNGFQANPENPKVTVSGDVDASGVAQIDFRDQGPGLSPDLAAKALDPFFTTRNVGVGLGLSVSKKVIEEHRGRLEIHAGKPGRITVSLPCL